MRIFAAFGDEVRLSIIIAALLESKSLLFYNPLFTISGNDLIFRFKTV